MLLWLLFLWKLGLSWCYYLIRFESVVWVQRCVSLVEESSRVCAWDCGWVCVCVWVCVEEEMTERARPFVGRTFVD